MFFINQVYAGPIKKGLTSDAKMQKTGAGRAIFALIVREIATSYGRTPGGYLWAILEPLGAVILMAGVFSLAFDSPPLGRDFALFYASGYLPFACYSDLSQKIGVALRFSRPLMAYPAVTAPDALVARFLLNTITHALVIALILAAMIMYFGTPAPMLGPLLLGVGLAAVLGAGLGAINAVLFEFWPVWERLWAIANRPVFILSGVLFLPDAVPAPYDDMIWLNPLVHAVTAMRIGLYPDYAPDGFDPFYPLAVGGVLLVVGLLVLRRTARDLTW